LETPEAIDRKYLIYIDILGFEELPRQLARVIHNDEDRIRQNLLSEPLRKVIQELESEGAESLGGVSVITGSDNYILQVSEVQSVFECVGVLARIPMLVPQISFLPLEIAAGPTSIEDPKIKPINRKETIDFLKNDIINPFRRQFEQRHHERVKQTFFVITKEMFQHIEPPDRPYCTKISYANKRFFEVDLSRVLERCKMFDFLKKIGYSGDRWYSRIDEAYVPPFEYDDMASTLEKKRILFITGTPEYGKTFTAVKLMWNYFNEKYEPIWHRGGEELDRRAARSKLENLGAELKPHRIIYFEDPFGKTRYERRENLEREIGTIVETVTHTDDVYVIITSREEIFKQFTSEKVSARDLVEFERKLNIKKPSYDEEKMEQMLVNWASVVGCKWIGNSALRNYLIEEIRTKNYLPTPLSRRDFVLHTVRTIGYDQLSDQLELRSIETSKAFAQEIRNMTPDKVIFLALLYITHDVSTTSGKRVYEAVVEQLKEPGSMSFDMLVDWFKDDKITVRENVLTEEDFLSFSHPSYLEAFRYLRIQDAHPTWINDKIIYTLLTILADEDELDSIAADELTNNFPLFSNVQRESLMVKLASRSSTAERVAELLMRRFKELPLDLRHRLFTQLTLISPTAKLATEILNDRFDDIPKDSRNAVLTDLKVNQHNAEPFAKLVSARYDQIPYDIRTRMISELVKYESASMLIALFVV
jgi:hypothetical protein